MVESNTTDFPLNHMDSPCEDNKEDRQYWCINQNYTMLIIAGGFFVVCLCGLVGNMVVVRFLGFHMKKNPFTVYVLNLAIADFSLLLFILVILTLSILSIVKCYEWYKYVMSRNILMVVFLFFYYASMYLLTAMSMERCLSVLFPIWYRCRRPKHLSGIVCGVLWALVAIFASLLLVSCSFPLTIRCAQVLNVLSPLNFLIFCLLPLLPTFPSSSDSDVAHIDDNQGSSMLLSSSVWSSCLSLGFIFVLSLTILIFVFHLDTYLAVLLRSGFLLAPLNSSINPVIYFLVGSSRKHHCQSSVKVALRRVFEDKAVSEDRRHVPEDTAVEITG